MFLHLLLTSASFYEALGVVEDVKDHLIFWAYNRQRDCNPSDGPYYFQCLNVLAQGRSSDMLSFEAVRLKSQGEFTTEDFKDACKAIDIGIDVTDEDLIIGIFRSRLADSPRQETQLREHLRIIGKTRNSAKILLAARKGMFPRL